MPRHCGASQFHDGALRGRTRKARKTRGRKKQSIKDKAALAVLRHRQEVT